MFLILRRHKQKCRRLVYFQHLLSIADYSLVLVDIENIPTAGSFWHLTLLYKR